MNTGTIAKSNDGFGFSMERRRKLVTELEQSGGFLLIIERKNGSVEDYTFPNSSTTEGKNYLLDAGFRNSGTTANWYMSLVDEDGFSAFSSADTMVSHAGWTEFQTYNEAARQTWTKSAASGGIMNASAAAQFTIGAVSAGQYLKGAFVTSGSVKGATTGVLWATGQFPADIPIQEDDVLNLTYFTQLT